MHPNARLTPVGRLILVERIAAGRPVRLTAAEMGVSHTTAYRWWARYRHEGAAGLGDRSSRPRRSPKRTPAVVEARIVELRRTRQWGPDRIGPTVGVPSPTVHRVLAWHGVSRLAWLDRPAAVSGPVPANVSSGRRNRQRGSDG